jgi:hypothetical protein
MGWENGKKDNKLYVLNKTKKRFRNSKALFSFNYLLNSISDASCDDDDDGDDDDVLVRLHGLHALQY